MLRPTEKELDALRDRIAGTMSAKRLRHTLGVELKAAELAGIFMPDGVPLARAAALLHDITKEYTAEEHIRVLERNGAPVTEECLRSPKLFHSYTAYYVIQEKYPGYADPELLHAVRVHTTGDVAMSMLDRILYLSDYIEDGRTWPSCVKLREYFERKMASAHTPDEKLEVLDRTMLRSYSYTISELLEDGLYLAESTVRARNALLLSMTERGIKK